MTKEARRGHLSLVGAEDGNARSESEPRNEISGTIDRSDMPLIIVAAYLANVECTYADETDTDGNLAYTLWYTDESEGDLVQFHENLRVITDALNRRDTLRKRSQIGLRLVSEDGNKTEGEIPTGPLMGRIAPFDIPLMEAVATIVGLPRPIIGTVPGPDNNLAYSVPGIAGHYGPKLGEFHNAYNKISSAAEFRERMRQKKA